MEGKYPLVKLTDQEIHIQFQKSFKYDLKLVYDQFYVRNAFRSGNTHVIIERNKL